MTVNEMIGLAIIIISSLLMGMVIQRMISIIRLSKQVDEIFETYDMEMLERIAREQYERDYRQQRDCE